MTITYFLMLFFVFITLFVVSIGRMFTANGGGIVCSFLWALLGTLFFHNVW